MDGLINAARGILTALLVLAAGPGLAEEPAPAAEVATTRVDDAAEEPQKIRDNLFLMEEAYNQEPGVIQHIQAFQVAPGSGDWSYSFTEEWPVPTDRHQVSITVPLVAVGGGGAAGIGDLLLNYRLQVVGMGGKGPVAFAPRLSIAFPTGDSKTGAGRGMLGVQGNLPLSIELGRWFVTHLNAGLTVTPAARSQGGAQATAVDVNGGAALVFLAAESVNLLVEGVYLSTANVLDDGSIGREHAWVVNPGIRFAVTFPWGLQIVPGLSVPVTMRATGVEVSALAYLSFEHTLWKP